MIEQPGQLRHGQIRWRAAAKMQLSDGASATEQRALQLYFAIQALQILLGVRPVARDDLVTAAVETRVLTERNVNIHRQRPHSSGIAQQRRAAIRLLVETGVKMNRGGVGG